MPAFIFVSTSKHGLPNSTAVRKLRAPRLPLSVCAASSPSTCCPHFPPPRAWRFPSPASSSLARPFPSSREQERPGKTPPPPDPLDLTGASWFFLLPVCFRSKSGPCARSRAYLVCISVRAPPPISARSEHCIPTRSRAALPSPSVRSPGATPPAGVTCSILSKVTCMLHIFLLFLGKSAEWNSPACLAD